MPMKAYRDGDTVFKHANEVVTFNAGGPDEKILGLSVPERIMLKNEIVTHQNRFGSHLPAGVFPKATELDGIWMRQNYIGGKVPNGLVGSEELAFLADRDLYVNMAVDSLSIKHKSTFKMFDDNSGFVYRVGNTLVASDWDRRNLRIHDGKTYWFDPAMVWPLELLNNKK